jgi:linoleoyl-CoA desaturase
MRFSPDQPRYKHHKYQFLYAPFLYALMALYWLIGKDYMQVKRYDKKGLLEGQGLTLRKAMTHMLIHKTWYVALTIVLPFILLPFAWWQILIGFLLMQFICGEVLALIFQPAHVIEETDFFVPKEDGSIENNWAIHQMMTTANFAQGSRLFSWFIGGLNFQIEHHLFPNICHVHYRKISKIVKETAKEYGLPYHQHKTFVSALASHFKLLYQLGTSKYDQTLAKA